VWIREKRSEKIWAVGSPKNKYGGEEGGGIGLKSGHWWVSTELQRSKLVGGVLEGQPGELTAHAKAGEGLGEVTEAEITWKGVVRGTGVGGTKGGRKIRVGKSR